MARHCTTVKFNSDALMEFLKERGYTKSKLARSIGYTRAYISMVFSNGRITQHLLDIIGEHFDIDANQFKYIDGKNWVKRYWKDEYEYKRILEILDDYWLTSKDEVSVIVDMQFLKSNGEYQKKQIRWVSPSIRSSEGMKNE